MKDENGTEIKFDEPGKGHQISMQTFYDRKRFVEQFGWWPIGRKKKVFKRHDQIERLVGEILAKEPIKGLLRITIVNEQDAVVDGIVGEQPASYRIKNFMEV